MHDIYYDPKTDELMVIFEREGASFFVYWCETEYYIKVISFTEPYWVKIGEL